MNKTAKFVIVFLIFVIIALSVLLRQVTVGYLNLCKIAGMSVSITNHEFEQIVRKKAAEADNKKDINLVNLKVEDVTDTSATIVITDKNEQSNKFNWNENYVIKKKIDNEYVELNTNHGFNLTDIYIGESNEYRQKVNWSTIYGNLEKGKYIIEKMVIQTNSTVSFVTEEFEIK